MTVTIIVAVLLELLHILLHCWQWNRAEAMKFQMNGWFVNTNGIQYINNVSVFVGNQFGIVNTSGIEFMNNVSSLIGKSFVNTNGIQYINNVFVFIGNQFDSCSNFNVDGMSFSQDMSLSPMREQLRVPVKISGDGSGNSCRDKNQIVHQGKAKLQRFINGKNIENRDDNKQIHPLEYIQEALEIRRFLRLALALKIVEFAAKFKCESSLAFSGTEMDSETPGSICPNFPLSYGILKQTRSN